MCVVALALVAIRTDQLEIVVVVCSALDFRKAVIDTDLIGSLCLRIAIGTFDVREALIVEPLGKLLSTVRHFLVGGSEFPYKATSSGATVKLPVPREGLPSSAHSVVVSGSRRNGD